MLCLCPKTAWSFSGNDHLFLLNFEGGKEFWRGGVGILCLDIATVL